MNKMSAPVRVLTNRNPLSQEWFVGTRSMEEQFVTSIIFENHDPAVVKKIMVAGCAGVMGKSVTKSPGSFSIIQLSAITKEDLPVTMFSHPANYQEDKSTALYGMQ